MATKHGSLNGCLTVCIVLVGSQVLLTSIYVINQDNVSPTSILNSVTSKSNLKRIPRVFPSVNSLVSFRGNWTRNAASRLELGWNKTASSVMPELQGNPRDRPTRADLLDSSRHQDLDKHMDLMIPVNFPFLPDYKAPCWFESVRDLDSAYQRSPYIDERETNVALLKQTFALMKDVLRQRLEDDGFAWRLRCLPYFYLVASPRSGTSDIYNSIVAHNHVTNSLVKEQIYWNRIRYMKLNISEGPELNHRYSVPVPMQYYLELNDFSSETIRQAQANDTPPGLPSHYKVFGDVTPSYMFDFDAWRMLPPNRELQQPRYVVADLIHNVTPKAKIIFILRNPVERVFSDYNFFQVKHLERTPQGFDGKVRVGIKALEECFERNSIEFCLHDMETSLSALPVKLRASLYEPLMKEWFRVFPKEQTLVLKFEEYAVDKITALKRIFRFLELDEWTERRYRRFLSNYATHSNQSSKREYHRIDQMLNSTREILEHFYKPWNEKLATLLDDPRFLWQEN